MPCIISIVQRKGGVGKTTLAVSLAAELHKRRKDVALIDSDPQRSACQWAEPGNLEFSVYEIALADRPVSVWAQDVKRVEARFLVIDTAPEDQALGASIALSNLVLVPCTPSGLDLEATARTLKIINAVRARRQGRPDLILVPNRVDSRTLEGRQLVDELNTFGELVGPVIHDRTAFKRAFSTGQSVADFAMGEAPDYEIQALCSLAEKFLVSC